MKNLLIIVAIVAIVGCGKNEGVNDEETQSMVYVNVGVSMTFVNSEGVDLLNPDNPNHFPFENMKLYYLIADEKVEVYKSDRDTPRNIALDTETTPYRLGIATYIPEQIMETKTEITTAYLELNSEITDTIVAELHVMTSEKSINKNLVNTKVWYNNVPVDLSEQSYNVIK